METQIPYAIVSWRNGDNSAKSRRIAIHKNFVHSLMDCVLGPTGEWVAYWQIDSVEGLPQIAPTKDWRAIHSFAHAYVRGRYLGEFESLRELTKDPRCAGVPKPICFLVSDSGKLHCWTMR